jgi:hypothetical protein
MVSQSKATAEDLIRLDAIAEHLKISSRYGERSFSSDVTAACVARTKSVIRKLLPCTGEQIAIGLAEHFRLVFEEVRGPLDIAKLKKHYLHGKKEIGFAQLEDELYQPGIDALLFERMNANDGDHDKWVAVLNLQETEAKGYWNRFHEFVHRIAEPPQQILPLRRHKFEATNPVERLVDTVAAEFAFYGPAFRPLCEQMAKLGPLTIDAVEKIRAKYAPTASLQATLKAVTKHWPNPAAAIIAEIRGRKSANEVARALRVTPQQYSDNAATAGLKFFPNMRVPVQSPIHEAFQLNTRREAVEHLAIWDTSTGDCLASIDVYTSAVKIGSRVYAVISA